MTQEDPILWVKIAQIRLIYPIHTICVPHIFTSIQYNDAVTIKLPVSIQDDRCYTQNLSCL